MKRLLKEPLLHFVIAGALMFGAYGWLDRNTPGKIGPGAGTVRISTSEVAWLKETWVREWQREPTSDELRGLVTGFLKEELLAREARAMGLDENDVIIRRWLAQKLEFLVQDTSRLAVPTEDELQRFYAAHPERFQSEARVSFQHVYFSRERRKDAAADAKAALRELSRAQPRLSASQVGDPLLIDSEIQDADEQTVAGQFGGDFARAVFKLAPGAWHGPIESGYGLHVVRVSELKSGQQREFAEVHAKVLELWREQRQRENNEKYFAGLLKKYEVVMDESVKPLVGPLVTKGVR